MIKNNFKILAAIFLFALLTIYSCQKDELINVENAGGATINEYNEELMIKYSSTGKFQFNEKIERKKLGQKVLWALGASGRIFRSYDDGTSWTEPAPSASAKQISAGDGGLWGISPDDRIWTWNGAGWVEPAWWARAVQVSCISSSTAIVVTSAGNVYITTDTGLSYNSMDISGTGPLQEVSSGAEDNILGVTNDEKLVRYNINTLKFDMVGAVTEFIAASQTPGTLFAVGGNNRLFLSNNFGVNWTEPNANNVVYGMTTYMPNKIFAIGASNRIFKSTDNGENWTEPNPSSTATQITNGWEDF